ncbi:hypothetical protein [Sphingomonas desiccabilis]|uniref:Uncharacterized protein n=1 Tax=Sphingomonas desiccabilis TaxID=429134 RepID=A0A4Q2IU99_9SPHN|nr:hypothetical protein [Sphingomonas desiccabilis]MBB3911233.1 hypothetical protein [Sphingomonas desiccabilis]RXZ31971.1 hypothetical protein EO081_12340 [Sphingomonas desiccabilis]
MVLPIIVLIALAIYCAFPHPTHNQAQLEAIAADAEHLMATHPLGPSDQSADIPKGKWPPSIAKLEPYSVTVHHGMVDITTKPFFDGGWGYSFAPYKQDATTLVECWSELEHGVYWHVPC